MPPFVRKLCRLVKYVCRLKYNLMSYLEIITTSITLSFELKLDQRFHKQKAYWTLLIINIAKLSSWYDFSGFLGMVFFVSLFLYNSNNQTHEVSENFNLTRLLDKSKR